MTLSYSVAGSQDMNRCQQQTLLKVVEFMTKTLCLMIKINILKPDFQNVSLINSDKLTLKTSVALSDKYVRQFDFQRAIIPFCVCGGT